MLTIKLNRQYNMSFFTYIKTINNFGNNILTQTFKSTFCTLEYLYQFLHLIELLKNLVFFFYQQYQYFIEFYESIIWIGSNSLGKIETPAQNYYCCSKFIFVFNSVREPILILYPQKSKLHHWVWKLIILIVSVKIKELYEF